MGIAILVCVYISLQVSTVFCTKYKFIFPNVCRAYYKGGEIQYSTTSKEAWRYERIDIFISWQKKNKSKETVNLVSVALVKQYI